MPGCGRGRQGRCSRVSSRQSSGRVSAWQLLRRPRGDCASASTRGSTSADGGSGRRPCPSSWLQVPRRLSEHRGSRRNEPRPLLRLERYSPSRDHRRQTAITPRTWNAWPPFPGLDRGLSNRHSYGAWRPPTLIPPGMWHFCAPHVLITRLSRTWKTSTESRTDGNRSGPGPHVYSGWIFSATMRVRLYSLFRLLPRTNNISLEITRAQDPRTLSRRPVATAQTLP